jgi:hypothetical protein
MEHRLSVAARIRHRVALFGKQLAGWGTYLEQSPGREGRLRLELTIQLDNGRGSTLLQVADGRYLWTYRRLMDKTSLSRVDLIRVGEALEKAGRTPSPGKPGQWLGLGGLPRLLRALDDGFDFHLVERSEVGDLPAWTLHGRWKPEMLARVFPEHKEAILAGEQLDLPPLPDHMPDHVLLWLGQDDWFPYRIEYRRTRGDGDSAPGESVGKAVVVLELYEVTLDGPLDPARFTYNPGEHTPEDATDAFLSSLGLGEGGG